MKASMGGDKHRALKQFAIKEAIKTWGDRVFVVTQECDRFSIRVDAGIGHYEIHGEKDIHPDLMMLLADGVQDKKEQDYGRKFYVNPQLVIVECENSRLSTLVRGSPSVRLYAYLLLKERYRAFKKDDKPLFVLVTWEGNKDAYHDVGMWDDVWFLPGDGSAETVQEDAPPSTAAEE